MRTTTVLVAQTRRALIGQVLSAWIAQVGHLGMKEYEEQAARYHRNRDRWEMTVHFTPFVRN